VPESSKTVKACKFLSNYLCNLILSTLRPRIIPEFIKKWHQNAGLWNGIFLWVNGRIFWVNDIYLFFLRINTRLEGVCGGSIANDVPVVIDNITQHKIF
jgi:hypothetical protein